MKVSYSKKFRKQYRKLPQKIQKTFNGRLILFIESKRHPLLNTHGLRGKYSGLYSINITADIRAVLDKISKSELEFVAIGSHSELYS